MATRPATDEQKDKIAELQPGDIFTIHDRGGVSKAEFVRHKQVNIVGIIDGKQYNIPKCLFIEIIAKGVKKEPPKMDMKPGDLYYIKSNAEAILFEFVCKEKDNLIGKNPVTGGTARMHSSLFAGTVKQYQNAKRPSAKAE